MVTLEYKKMSPEVKEPFKKRPKDSGYDVFAFHFVAAFLEDGVHGEALIEATESGEIPGATTMAKGKVLSITLNPNERVMIGTGLQMVVRCTEGRNFELQARPRSGNSWERAMDIINSPGTVDSPYRGEVCIMIRNGSNKAQTIEIGEKIAQLVPMEVVETTLKEVDSLEETDRGANGFGSSGRT